MCLSEIRTKQMKQKQSLLRRERKEDDAKNTKEWINENMRKEFIPRMQVFIKGIRKWAVEAVSRRK